MPDLIEIFQQTGDVPSRNHQHATDAASTVDPTRFQIVAYGKDLDSPLLELADVLRAGCFMPALPMMYQPVLTVTDQDVDIGSPSISLDNRVLSFTFVAAEADVWLMTLE